MKSPETQESELGQKGAAEPVVTLWSQTQNRGGPKPSGHNLSNVGVFRGQPRHLYGLSGSIFPLEKLVYSLIIIYKIFIKKWH